MAILGDLVQETSFRRFYLRWLAACWLPVVAVAAIWAAAWTLGPQASLRILRIVTPVDAWILIALGQWLFLRRYSKLAGWWAVLTFIGGMVATLIWLTTTRTTFLVPMGLLSFIGLYLSQFLGVPRVPVFVVVCGAFAFGTAISIFQAPLLAQNRGGRRLWIMLSGGFSAIIIIFVFPHLQRLLNALRMDVMSFDVSISSPMFLPLLILTSMPTSLLAVWLLYSTGLGPFLWVMRRRQAWRENKSMAQVFD